MTDPLTIFFAGTSLGAIGAGFLLVRIARYWRAACHEARELAQKHRDAQHLAEAAHRDAMAEVERYRAADAERRAKLSAAGRKGALVGNPKRRKAA